MIYEKEESDFGLRVLLGVVLLASIIGGAIDLVLDAPDSLLSFHVGYEVLLILASLSAFILVWRAWFRARHQLADVRQELSINQAERDAWRESAESALAGFGKAIEERFNAWNLTPAESEVALNLLKGQSHKEIAYLTSRSERTVRQHAVAVYQKSGLRGRAELAAFFLDDLILPRAGNPETVSGQPENHRVLEGLSGRAPTSPQHAMPGHATSQE
jgi:DNA-binding CsgD family transcriptional regulator